MPEQNQQVAPEFRVPGTVTEGPSVPIGEPAMIGSDEEPQTTAVLVEIPLVEVGVIYGSRRIDAKVSVKAARGLRRLRHGLDAVGATRSNGRRINPNSPRDAIEWLLELIADAQ